MRVVVVVLGSGPRVRACLRRLALTRGGEVGSGKLAGGKGCRLEQKRHGGRRVAVLQWRLAVVQARLERSGRRLGGAPCGLLRGERRGRGRRWRWWHATVIHPRGVARRRLVQQARCLVPAR